MKVAAEELNEIQQAVKVLVPGFQASLPGPSSEDLIRVEREKLREQDLVVHDLEMSRLRRAHELENEVLKQDQLRQRLRGDMSLESVNRLLLRKYLTERYGISPQQ